MSTITATPPKTLNRAQRAMESLKFNWELLTTNDTQTNRDSVLSAIDSASEAVAKMEGNARKSAWLNRIAQIDRSYDSLVLTNDGEEDED